MTVLGPVRIFFHALLWTSAVILLGLTAYRVHYTKRLALGDILTSRRHFYDPVIVELLVTSCLTIIGSLGVLAALAARRKGRWGSKSFGMENIYLFIIWVMFLVGAAVTTHKWLRLKWCRGSYKVCRILETIKAFSWICFGLATFLILFAIVDWFLSRDSTGYATKPAAAPAAAYPETRTAAPTAVSHPHTTETTYTEVRAVPEPQQPSAAVV